MARLVKLTDEQLKTHLDDGMTVDEIVEKYDMNKSYLYTRIKKVREQGEEMKAVSGSQSDASADVKPLDTFVRKTDRKQFRVTEIDEKSAILKETTGEFGHAPKKAITVSMNELAEKFEKKDYPEVKIYKMNDGSDKSIEPMSVTSDLVEAAPNPKASEQEEVINLPAAEVPEPPDQEELESDVNAIFTRKDCLRAAERIVCNDRESTYGSPENNFSLIAELWTVYTGKKLTAKDVAIMMALLKIARIKTGKFKADNYIDLAGYAACACGIGGQDDK